MPPSPAPRSRFLVRLSVLVSNSLLCFGAFYLYDSIVSLQPFLIGAPCGSNASANCCASCLGFSPFEYNLLVGLPLAMATVGGLLLGYVIDRYGYCLFTAVSTFVMVLGAVIRALGASPGLSHGLSYALMLLGGVLVDNVFSILYIVQLYVCARWFSGRFLSLVVGVSLSVSMCGSVLAYYVTPFLHSQLGLLTTISTAIPVGATAVISALCLAAAEKFALGRNFGIIEQEENPKLSFNSLRNLSRRYWIISVVLAVQWLLFYAFIGNLVAYQTDIYARPYESASFSSGLTYIMKIVFSPIAGMIASRFNIHELMGLFGCFLEVAAMVMLSFGYRPAILIILLMGLGFAIVLTVVLTMLTQSVPVEQLGTATGIANAFLSISIGIGNTAVGALVDSHPDRVEGWLRSAKFLLAAAILETGLMALLMATSYKPHCCRTTAVPAPSDEDDEAAAKMV